MDSQWIFVYLCNAPINVLPPPPPPPPPPRGVGGDLTQYDIYRLCPGATFKIK